MRAEIRNFVIISHVDHGKSTLADRFLELTGTIEKRQFREQFLDQMDLERERGITIKMQPVRMRYTPHSAPDSLHPASYTLNLIDTPGHVDFAYEVSRALAAVEGAILLVDGTQGIQAQTLAHLELAKKEGLYIIGAVNKIDLAIPDIESLKREMAKLIGCKQEEIFEISAKTGKNVPQLLEAVITNIPPPAGSREAPLRALVFDSVYDPFQGSIAYVRVVDGTVRRQEPVESFGTGFKTKALEVGVFGPERRPQEALGAGEIGYIATGIKEPGALRVGDTITAADRPAVEPLAGYEEPKPMVFAGFYPQDAKDLPSLRNALQKLKLNDAALVFEPSRQDVLGQGFRVGFLGALHLEIVKERLSREYKIEPLITQPSVWYKALTDKGMVDVFTPADLPDFAVLKEIREPWVRLEVIAPQAYLQVITQLIRNNRGEPKLFETIGSARTLIQAEMPLAEMIVDFYDKLKSVSKGFASMSYELTGWRPADLVKLDILIAGSRQEALARIIPRADAEPVGRGIIEKLKEVLPAEVFPVPIQAAVGSRILARVTIPALRKDVTGYLYGGDRTRKMKLWEKQKRGKERLSRTGKVNIPAETFFEILKIGH